MKKQIYLFLNEPVTAEQHAVHWLVRDPQSGHIQNFQGEYSELARQSQEADLVAVVPGEHVLLSEVQLPGKQRQRLLQALPFALEDQLISDVDELHFVLGDKQQDDVYQAFVVDRGKMADWLSQLQQVGLSADKLIADYQLLDTLAESMTVVCDDQRCVVAGLGEGMAIARQATAEFVNIQLGAGETQTVVRFCGRELQQPVNAQLERIVDEVESVPTQLLKLATQSQPVNLLQGDFRQEKKRRFNLQVWYPAAAVLLIWFLLQLFSFVYNYIDLRMEKNHLDAEMLTLYKKTFPQAKHVIDPRRQMESSLKRLRGESGEQEGDFQQLFVQASRDMQQAKGLQLQSVRYRNGRIQFELQLDSLQELDELKRKLQQHAGWQVEVQNAAAEKNVVNARLEIRKDAS